MARSIIHSLYSSTLFSRLSLFGPDQLKARALVFAPHQDDETLACGGTVYLKKQAGASVKMVFMTDGSNSHPGLIKRAELQEVRGKEAVAAAAVLGVDQEDLFFLDFEDGHLSEARQGAVAQVEEILRQQRPEQVFIPYTGEPPADHWITTEIVLDAMARCSCSATVYEYPVWYLYQWPWVGLGTDKGQWSSFIKKMIKSGLGTKPFFQFRSGVDIREALPVKRKALSQYRSQMEPYRSHPDWTTLTDVANGQFLQCFFSGYEVFLLRNR